MTSLPNSTPEILPRVCPRCWNCEANLTALPTTDPVVIEKRAQLDRILQACLGLEVETVIPQAEVVPGEEMKLHHSAIVRSGVPVRWIGERYPGNQGFLANIIELHPKQLSSRDTVQTLPFDTPLSQPYWLREEGIAGNVPG